MLALGIFGFAVGPLFGHEVGLALGVFHNTKRLSLHLSLQGLNLAKSEESKDLIYFGLTDYIWFGLACQRFRNSQTATEWNGVAWFDSTEPKSQQTDFVVTDVGGSVEKRLVWHKSAGFASPIRYVCTCSPHVVDKQYVLPCKLIDKCLNNTIRLFVLSSSCEYLLSCKLIVVCLINTICFLMFKLTYVMQLFMYELIMGLSLFWMECILWLTCVHIP